MPGGRLEQRNVPAPEGRQAAIRAARDFLSLLLTISGRRTLAGMLGLILAGSLAESAGLLLLVPVMHMIGIGGEALSVPPARLALGLGLYLLLVVAGAGVIALRTIESSRHRAAFLDRLREDLHGDLLRVSWPCFQTLRASDVKQIITGETVRLAVCYDSALRLLVEVLTVPMLLLAALLLSPVLTLVTALVAGLSLLLIRRIGRSGFHIGHRLGQASREMMADLTDDLAGLRTIKLFGAGASRRSNLRHRFEAVRSLQQQHVRIQAAEHAAMTVTAALIACVAVLAALFWLALPLPAALAVILAFARLAQRGLGAVRVWRQLESSLPAVQAYQEMRARLRSGAEPEAERPSDAESEAEGQSLPPLSQGLRFDGVGLRMPDGRQALAGVDVDLPAGTLLAVVGPSGAGKSSLADLAAGLTHPTAGMIRVDGRALTPALLPAWRRQVALVPQDPFLFHDSVRANLLLAAPAADEAALWAALADAGAADFVRTLPRGLDTVVGERGGALSGGERQRLAIARALLRQPRLLVLDEATAALDAGSEALVLRTLERLRGRITILAVTHRPATRDAADLVLELADGHVVSLAPPLGT